jgi:hypothetical protein
MDRVTAGKASADVGKLLDESLLDELEKEGFFKSLAR